MIAVGYEKGWEMCDCYESEKLSEGIESDHRTAFKRGAGAPAFTA